MDAPAAPAAEHDLHDLARALPHVELVHGPSGNPIYQVGRKSFVYFRTPRPDAFDPVTGERYDDVVILRVDGEDAKQALVQDPATPFFTTPHFDGYDAVLVRLSRLAELTRLELAELVEDAWLSRASARRARVYLDSGHRITD
ncbi:MAG: MmcQ/YjbR family DNA-binding protein [Propionicimonas sp.]|uniref:MmcQ/YjbR family DNA-binding protein n=1 Tax=Propionicimonas sp. TaxID=1955623 RepID=UPI003D11A5E2